VLALPAQGGVWFGVGRQKNRKIIKYATFDLKIGI
jgi:hypothetical protein